jgi:putative ATPase
VVYLALSPKSNAVYTAYQEALDDATNTSHLPPPKTMINAPTQFMKKMGYGKGYIYDHDKENGFSGQNYFPDSMERRSYYHPAERGFERELKLRLDYFIKLRKKILIFYKEKTLCILSEEVFCKRTGNKFVFLCIKNS